VPVRTDFVVSDPRWYHGKKVTLMVLKSPMVSTTAWAPIPGTGPREQLQERARIGRGREGLRE
jgi:hypothetical protein